MCQLIWALIGMGLTFCLMSYVLRKFSWVTMLVFIFFSGLDVIPFLADVFTNGYPAPDPFTGDGIFTHIELMLLRFNSSSSTTLLFWVYNQAIPFWVCFLLILLQKNNRCLLFTYSLLALFAPLPMIGALPAVVYLMLHNEKVTLHSFFKKLGPLIAHQLNVQNIAAIVQIGIIVLFYTTNISAGNIQLNPIDGPTVLSYLYFFMIEFGVFLLWLLPASLKSRLCITLMVSTMIFNFIRVGSSFDFAWRTTMMFTFFVMIFVINKLIHKWHKTRWFSKAAIILLLVAGAVTPGMEIARTVHNTRVIITEQNNPGTYAEDSYQYVISQQTLRLDYLHGLVELTDEDIENIEAYSNFLGDASDAKAFNRYLRK